MRGQSLQEKVTLFSTKTAWGAGSIISSLQSPSCAGELWDVPVAGSELALTGLSWAVPLRAGTARSAQPSSAWQGWRIPAHLQRALFPWILLPLTPLHLCSRSLSCLAQAEHFHKNKSVAGGISRTVCKAQALQMKVQSNYGNSPNCFILQKIQMRKKLLDGAKRRWGRRKMLLIWLKFISWL